MLIGVVIVIVAEIGSLMNWVLLRLLNFVGRFRLKLMYLSLLSRTTSNLIHLQGVYILVFLSLFRKFAYDLSMFKEVSYPYKKALESIKFVYADQTRESYPYFRIFSSF